jgi:hypothetical protein
VSAPFSVDTSALEDVAGRWESLAGDLGAPAPSGSGEWASGAGAQAFSDTAGKATDRLKDRVGHTADQARKAGNKYQTAEDENRDKLKAAPVDIKQRNDKQDIRDKLKQVRVVPDLLTPDGPYDRKCGDGHACDFGPAWHDGIHDCPTRNRILADNLNDIKYGPDGCSVRGGWMIDPYSGKRITEIPGPRTQIQIDHVYPLARAWDMGADKWTQEQRIAFANDTDDNLLPVSAVQNQAKGDCGPAQWLPPLQSEQMDYIDRYLTVATKYGLPITKAEFDTMSAMAQ